MRKILAFSLTICVLCTLINMSSAHPLLDKLEFESKKQLASCPANVTCFELTSTCFDLRRQGYNCKTRKLIIWFHR